MREITSGDSPLPSLLSQPDLSDETGCVNLKKPPRNYFIIKKIADKSDVYQYAMKVPGVSMLLVRKKKKSFMTRSICP